MKPAKPIDQKPWLCGPLTRGKAGRHHYEPPLNLPTPTRVCGASMPNAEPGEITRIMQGNTRAHSSRTLHPSVGGC